MKIYVLIQLEHSKHTLEADAQTWCDRVNAIISIHIAYLAYAACADLQKYQPQPQEAADRNADPVAVCQFLL